MAMEHAVCVTGEERSFGEIGHNVREALLLMLGPRIGCFGVRPAADAWPLLRKLLPFVVVEEQRRCWSGAQLNWTIQWLRCDMSARAHDCRASFLQQLCDLRHCEAIIGNPDLHAGVTEYALFESLR